VVVGLAGLVGLVTGVALLWWFPVCEHACSAMQREVQELFERGEYVAALTRLDRVDARCHCSRFTSGDMPPEYALAEVCIRRLRAEGRGPELDGLLERARGAILHELSRAPSEPTR
jgi:hypothetical protein